MAARNPGNDRSTPAIVFIRHSLPEIDLTRPAREWHLSEAGRLRCKTLASQLAYINPQCMVSSLEPKAIETAQILADALGLDFETANDLHEHLRREAYHSSQEDFESSVRNFFKQPGRLVFGEETADQTHARFAQAVQTIQERSPAQTPLVIVTHGTVITLYVARAYNREPFPFWKNLKLPCMVICSPLQPKMISLDSPFPYFKI
jgi:broad specificity phosphatase PhoE